MTITIELTRELVDQLKKLTKLDNDPDAVSQAAHDYVRLRRLRELKDICGKVDFDETSSSERDA
jgi:hypothetical protein